MRSFTTTMRVAVITKDTVTISENERLIVDMLAHGKRTREIAKTLDISIRTAEGRLNAMRDKFKVETQMQLVAFFLSEGIIQYSKKPKAFKPVRVSFHL